MDNPTSHLIREFSRNSLKPFTADEFQGELSAQSFAPRATLLPALPELSQLERHHGVGAFIRFLEEYLSKFEFGRDSMETWSREYVFPRHSSINKYCREAFGKNNSARRAMSYQIANKSEEGVSRWIDEAILRPLADNEHTEKHSLLLLLGGVGCGKSSFNKYVTNYFFSKFQHAKVVTSRVEYRKFCLYLQSSQRWSGKTFDENLQSIQPHATQYIAGCLVRDLFFHLYTEVSKGADGENYLTPTTKCLLSELDISQPASEQQFKEFLDDNISPDAKSTRPRILHEITRAKRAFTSSNSDERALWFANYVKDPIAMEALEHYLLFAAKSGLKFFLIFDGYDFVEAADYLQKTSHCMMMTAVAEWIMENRGKVVLPHCGSALRTLIQITMRTSTHDMFWLSYSRAYDQFRTSKYYIAPPEYKDVYKNLIDVAEIKHGSSDAVKAAELLSLFRRVQDTLRTHLQVPTHQISGLFLENVRHRINYSKDVIEDVSRDAVYSFEDPDAVTPGMLLGKIRSNIDEYASSKWYRLIDLLLHSRNSRFTNFIRVEDIKRWLDPSKHGPFLIEEILKDNNYGSGYIGNVFNYHVPYDSFGDLRFFLEKPRIIDVLLGSKEGALSIEQVRAAFGSRGWPISSYFDISFSILVRERLIHGVANAGYEPTPLGKLMNETLMNQMVYLESVFFGCLLPSLIKRSAVNIDRATAKSRGEWVAASIFHVWILLRLVRTAEQGSTERFFEPMRLEVLSALRAILQRDASLTSVYSRSVPEQALKLINAFSAQIEDR